ncbi:MAG TPA: pro-sigmaK processing inhibitor BofA [Firmicutes bacterium]|nr:pro-sigmaK processing inhibitor BofA [Bacillota bacterium]
MDWTVVVAYLFGLLLLYLLANVLLIPLRFVMRLIYNGVIGGILLWIINIMGRHFDIMVPINPITALVAGFLGIPGIVLLIALRHFLIG